MAKRPEDEDFDWCSFFALFRNDKGVNARVHVADTVIFRHGQLCAWWFTNQEGRVQRQSRQKATLMYIKKRFLESQSKNTQNYVAILRRGTDRPVVLTTSEFTNFIKEVEYSKDSDGIYTCLEEHQNVVLQLYIEPLGDIRYITTYVNTGFEMTSHTFQRHFSQRYMTTEIREVEEAEEKMTSGDKIKHVVAVVQNAVDPVVKMQLRALIQQVVKYIQRAHGFTLSVLRAEWASNTNGNGSGSMQCDSYVRKPEELDPIDVEEVNIQASGDSKQGLGAPGNGSARYPGGGYSATNGATSFNLINTWPSVHHQNLQPWRVSPNLRIPCTGAPGPINSSWRPASAPKETLSSRQSPRRESRPLIVSHLTQEVEGLRDEVLLQYQLAEASAAKVRTLEKEKEIAFLSFSHCLEDLETQLSTKNVELAQTVKEKESLQKISRDLEMKIEELEKRNREMKTTLDQERQTALASLREYQSRDKELSAQVQETEERYEHLQGLFQEEKAANSALKRQLLQNMDTHKPPPLCGLGRDLAPVTEMISKLLECQENPEGERYALIKVLETNHDGLRAVFLHYCQLDHTFTDQWPPCLTMDGWEEFYRDAGVSDPRAGARICSSSHGKMVSVREMEEIFHHYSHTDPSRTKSYPSLSYEGFLAAISDCGNRVKTDETPFLSETVRAFIARYILKAKRIKAPGIIKSRVKIVATKKNSPRRKSQGRASSSR